MFNIGDLVQIKHDIPDRAIRDSMYSTNRIVTAIANSGKIFEIESISRSFIDWITLADYDYFVHKDWIELVFTK